MTSVSTASRGSGGGASRTIRFRHWILWHQPLRAAIPLTRGLISAIAIALIDGRWPTAILVLGVVLATTWYMWLPITWEIGPRGLSQRVVFLTRRMVWQEVELVDIGSHGFVVRPLGCHSWIASLRSLYVPYPPDKADLARTLLTQWARSGGMGNTDQLVAEVTADSVRFTSSVPKDQT